MSAQRTYVDDEPTRVMLLIEDNPGDADLVREMLENEPIDLIHVSSLTAAAAPLRSSEFDVILLDLALPDSSGLESLQVVLDTAVSVPVVVLTGTDDEDVAMACIDAGAQDYLTKEEIRPVTLRRAIGYAISRQREQQIRQLQETLGRLRSMSSAGAPASVTASLSSVGPVSVRQPEIYEDLVVRYHELLRQYLQHLITQVRKPSPAMRQIAQTIGKFNGGPRDLLDIHIDAVEREIVDTRDSRARAVTIESRLFALEMMGLLVEYYRIGVHLPIEESVQ